MFRVQYCATLIRRQYLQKSSFLRKPHFSVALNQSSYLFTLLALPLWKDFAAEGCKGTIHPKISSNPNFTSQNLRLRTVEKLYVLTCVIQFPSILNLVQPKPHLTNRDGVGLETRCVSTERSTVQCVYLHRLCFLFVIGIRPLVVISLLFKKVLSALPPCTTTTSENQFYRWDKQLHINLNSKYGVWMRKFTSGMSKTWFQIRNVHCSLRQCFVFCFIWTLFFIFLLTKEKI